MIIPQFCFKSLNKTRKNKISNCETLLINWELNRSLCCAYTRFHDGGCRAPYSKIHTRKEEQENERMKKKKRECSSKRAVIS